MILVDNIFFKMEREAQAKPPNTAQVSHMVPSEINA